MEPGDSSLWPQQDALQATLGLSVGLLSGMNLEKGSGVWLVPVSLHIRDVYVMGLHS